MGWGGCYDRLCCPASPKLLLGLDLGLGCDNYFDENNSMEEDHDAKYYSN